MQVIIEEGMKCCRNWEEDMESGGEEENMKAKETSNEDGVKEVGKI